MTHALTAAQLHDTLPPLLTAAEVAELLDVSERTLEAWRGSFRPNLGPDYIFLGPAVLYWRSSVISHVCDIDTGRELDIAELLEALPEEAGDTEVAAALGVSRRTLESWRRKHRDRKGPAYSIVGRRVTYRRSDIVDFLNETTFTK